MCECMSHTVVQKKLHGDVDTVYTIMRAENRYKIMLMLHFHIFVNVDCTLLWTTDSADVVEVNDPN
jgi:hypothetical protein